MKLMKDMNTAELIELVATVSVRVIGFDRLLTALYFLNHLSHYLSQVPSTSSYTVNGYLLDIFLNAIEAIVMLTLTIPLARLLTRGLATSLALKSNSSDESQNAPPASA